jgi:hypothetical protein
MGEYRFSTVIGGYKTSGYHNEKSMGLVLKGFFKVVTIA